MLIYRRTSLLESSAQTLVNTVNCVGVMGKGIALEFKEREPQMFAAYRRICDKQLLAPGKLWLWKGVSSWVLNFPTKKHWRNPSKIEWIESGLEKFSEKYASLGIKEISFPRLGCGNGGLDWADVRPVMEKHLKDLPIPVYVHDFTKDIGLPEHMESVAQKLEVEAPEETNFDAFISSLFRAVELTRDNLSDLTAHTPIEASVGKDDILKMRSGEASWVFEKEDLWGVWIGLQTGLLTKEKAGWSTRGGGKPLLSLLSVLPHMRPVEIQAVEGDPELAVEYRLGRGAPADLSRNQLELACP
ncbi:macro domain-containing protein [Bradyrhizobium sp. th.b2]|uniref:macro domain-containing protein n=1 Tax=Bradyrhizobium sp. th-b2 TaxID=172088 RepID=UPI0003F5D9F8|nr:macro domain-containing protein [Bradyrhizobium sp. th.b2]